MTFLASASVGPGDGGRLSPPPIRASEAERQRARRRYRSRRTLTAYAFLAPVLIFFSVFLLAPVVWVFFASFQDGSILTALHWVGVRNWQALANDATAQLTLRNTAEYTAIVVPGMIIGGLAVGLLLAHVRRGGTFLRALVYFPTLSPLVVAGLVWMFIVQKDFGAFNLGLRLLGGAPQNWLGNPALALPTVATVEVWRGIGFWAVFFLATLVALPSELYQAAHLDGTSTVQRFRFLTLPLMKTAFLFAMVLATIHSLQIFDSVYVMTDGGPANASASLVWYVYRNLFAYDRLGYAAAISCILLLVILALTLIQMRVLRATRTV